MPVDSEHSAISQVLRGEERETLKKIIITASGGAFRSLSIEAEKSYLSKLPNIQIGYQRITIDSASMFNKALEVIEAKEFLILVHQRLRC